MTKITTVYEENTHNRVITGYDLWQDQHT